MGNVRVETYPVDIIRVAWTRRGADGMDDENRTRDVSVCLCEARCGNGEIVLPDVVSWGDHLLLVREVA